MQHEHALQDLRIHRTSSLSLIKAKKLVHESPFGRTGIDDLVRFVDLSTGTSQSNALRLALGLRPTLYEYVSEISATATVRARALE